MKLKLKLNPKAIKGLVRKGGRYLASHRNGIAAGLSIFGVAATAVCAAEAGKKQEKLKEEGAPKLEQAKAYFIPAVVGIATCCLIGTNYRSMKQQITNLAGVAVSMANQTPAKAESEEEEKEFPFEGAGPHIIPELVDPFTHQVRYDVPYEEIVCGMYNINRMLNNCDFGPMRATVNDILYELGFERKPGLEKLGYDSFALVDRGGVPWLDFDVREDDDAPGVWKFVIFDEPTMLSRF